MYRFQYGVMFLVARASLLTFSHVFCRETAPGGTYYSPPSASCMRFCDSQRSV